MRVLVQRSQKSHVIVDNKIVGQIDCGLVLLVGFGLNDTEQELDYMVEKVKKLRIFNDENGIMNKNITEVNGQVLSISQFTLYADIKKGNRPSYKKSLNATKAKELYELFNTKLKAAGLKVATGIFQSHMLVNITNDGPVTILLESREEND